MYFHINVVVASILLLVSIVFAFLVHRHVLIVSILYLYFGPLSSSLKLDLIGFLFDFTLLLQFVLTIILYLRTNFIYKSKGQIWIVNLFLFGIILSNVSLLFGFIEDFQIFKFLRYFSTGFLGSINTLLFVFYLNAFNYDLEKTFISFAKFLSYYGVLVILEGYFNYISGFNSYLSSNISHNNQLFTFSGQGPDGIGRLVLMGFLCTLFLFNDRFSKFKVVLGFYILFGGFIIFLTLSRTIYILFAIMIIVFILRSSFRLFYFLFVVLVIPFIANFLNSSVYLIDNKSSSLYSMETLFYRFELINSAVEVFMNNVKLMFTGVGYRMCGPFIQSLGGVFRGGIQYENVSFENKFLELIIETGVVGLLFTLIFSLKSLYLALSKSFRRFFIYRDVALQFFLILFGGFFVNMDWIVLYIFYFIFLNSKVNYKVIEK